MPKKISSVFLMVGLVYYCFVVRVVEWSYGVLVGGPSWSGEVVYTYIKGEPVFLLYLLSYLFVVFGALNHMCELSWYLKSKSFLLFSVISFTVLLVVYISVKKKAALVLVGGLK